MTEDEEGLSGKSPRRIPAEEQLKAGYRQDSDCCLASEIPNSKQWTIPVLQALKWNNEYLTFWVFTNEGSGV